MKPLKIAGCALAALVTALCIYFWACSAYSWLTGTAPSVFGYHLRITGDEEITPALPPRTLLLLKPYEGSLNYGDIVVFEIPDSDAPSFAGQVLDLPDGESALVRYMQTSDDIIIPVSMITYRAEYTSTALGQIVYFAASPVGLAVMVALPVALLLLIRLVYLRGKKNKADSELPDELPEESQPKQTELPAGEPQVQKGPQVTENK